LAKRVDPDRVCAVLDDLPEDLLRAANLFGHESTILMQANHNRSAWEGGQSEQLVHDGEMAYRRIKERVDGWFDRYGERTGGESAEVVR
jgi:hypothetical protein